MKKIKRKKYLPWVIGGKNIPEEIMSVVCDLSSAVEALRRDDRSLASICLADASFKSRGIMEMLVSSHRNPDIEK